MAESESLRVSLGGRVWPARRLTDAERRRYDETLNAVAKKLNNPFDGFAEKLKVLPANLQEVALREFMQSDEYTEIPDWVYIAATGAPECMRLLSVMCLGEQIVTEENFQLLWPQFMAILELTPPKG